MGVDIETLAAGDGSTFPKPGQKVTCHYVLTPRTVERLTAQGTAVSLSSSTSEARGDRRLGRGCRQDVEGTESQVDHLVGYGLRSQRGSWTDSWRSNSYFRR